MPGGPDTDRESITNRHPKPQVSHGRCRAGRALSGEKVIRSSKKTLKNNRMIRALDAACRALIFERDENRCQRCGRTEGEFHPDGFPVVLQWSHVKGRRFHGLRWEPDNSKVLCSKCHMWWGNNPILAIDWFVKKWPERWANITRVLQLNPKTNVRALYEALK